MGVDGFGGLGGSVVGGKKAVNFGVDCRNFGAYEENCHGDRGAAPVCEGSAFFEGDPETF